MLADAIRLLLFPALMALRREQAVHDDHFQPRDAGPGRGFFALALFTGMTLDAVLWHMAAAVAVLAVAFTFFAQGWIGGGDAKLAAATALWLGFDHLLPYVLYASIFGGILTLAIIKFRLMPLPATLAEQEWVKRLHNLDGGVPYGIALAAAALLIYPKPSGCSPAKVRDQVRFGAGLRIPANVRTASLAGRLRLSTLLPV